MTNKSSQYGKAKLQAGNRWRSRATAMGWNDRMRNLPYQAAYDAWLKLDQLNYENGRLLASNAIAAGLPRRLIRASDRRKPAWYVEYREMAHRAVGDERVLGALPPSESALALLARPIMVRHMGRRIVVPGPVPTVRSAA